MKKILIMAVMMAATSFAMAGNGQVGSVGNSDASEVSHFGTLTQNDLYAANVIVHCPNEVAILSNGGFKKIVGGEYSGGMTPDRVFTEYKLKLMKIGNDGKALAQKELAVEMMQARSGNGITASCKIK